LTGQGFVKVTSAENKDWFKTLVVKPDLTKFESRQKQLWGSVDERPDLGLERSVYSSVYSADEHEDHAIHHAHSMGAAVSVVLVIVGIFMAFMMYYFRKIDPAKWVRAFSPWYRAIQNKYYFDHLYINIGIKKGLLGFNNALAFFDSEIYDRFVIDGIAKVNKVFYCVARFVDDEIVDRFVDTWGAFADGGHIALRLIQSGKIQRYFLWMMAIMMGYLLLHKYFDLSLLL
jgi:NADH-quinone oxidoreductase subunit L